MAASDVQSRWWVRDPIRLTNHRPILYANMAGKRSTTANAGARTAAGSQGAKAKAGKSRKQDSGGFNNPPVAVDGTIVNRGPRTRGTTDGSVVVSNTEFITDISTQSGILGYDLNPASSGLFTWLSRVAQGYELFRFTTLELIYTPVCSTSTGGMVVMAFDYDASDDPPINKQALSGYHGSVRGNVWNKLRCPLSPPAGWFFTGQSGTQTINPVNTDIKFYDAAKFYIGTFNYTTANNPVGELTVKYTIQFSKPDFGPPPSLGSSTSFANSSLTTPTGGATTLGTVPAVFSSDSTAKTFTLTFQRTGQFMVMFEADITASTTSFGIGSEAMQTDPGVNFSTSVTYAQRNAYWVNATSPFYANFMYAVSAYAGTTVTFYITSVVTALMLRRLRIMSYPKALN